MKALLIYNSKSSSKAAQAKMSLILRGFDTVCIWGHDSFVTDPQPPPFYFEDYDCIFILVKNGAEYLTKSQHFGANTKKAPSFLYYNLVNTREYRAYNIKSTLNDAGSNSNFGSVNSKWDNQENALNLLIANLKKVTVKINPGETFIKGSIKSSGFDDIVKSHNSIRYELFLLLH